MSGVPKPRAPQPPDVLKQPIKAVKRARALRKEMSLPEVLLWMQLRQRPGGFKFRKQVPQHPYTLDFACLSARLAIEVDGEAHNRGDQPMRDEVRDRVMAARGFRTLRLPAYEVLKNMEGCVAMIVAACANSSPAWGGGPPSTACLRQSLRINCAVGAGVGGVPPLGVALGGGAGPLRRFAPPPRAGEEL